MKRTFERYTVSLLFAGFAVFTLASAQQTCGTDYMYQEQLRKDPSIRFRREQLEQATAEYLAAHKELQTASVPVRIIPTVVHIIHNWGPENITDAQVYSAINIANEDLQKLNADTAQVLPAFQGIIGDMNIQLRLAQIDPNGNCTNGITRVASALTYNANDNVKTQLVSWDNSKYLNIWVVAKISFNAGGYSYYPGTAPPGCEGIVVLYTQFGGTGASCGSNFCRRTLTHELGHYFNLAHTWGSSNTCGDPGNCSIDDNVTDTPNTIGNCLTCNLNNNRCSVLENVENFMDYALCTKMFTKGQAMRSDAALNSTVGGRYYLWQPSNLTATGTDGTTLPPCVPVAYFRENTNMICVGDSVTYTDFSWNVVPTSWSWNFPGGTPSTSALQNPTVTYAAPGTYNVSLTAYSSSGGATFTKTNYIVVSPNTAAYSNWQYFEGFETSNIPNSDWIVRDTNGITWQRTGAAGYSGTFSAYINNYNNSIGDRDELISPSFDLTAINNPYLYFKVSFAQQDTTKDYLRVYVSRDCGKTWYMRYAEQGPNLATVSEQSSQFTPSNISQWRSETISLYQFVNDNNVRVKFEFNAMGGNNIYLDDINISGPLGEQELNGGNYAFTVFPNPSPGVSIASFDLPSSARVALTVHDVLGREVKKIPEKEMNAGKQKVEISTAGLLPGAYFVTLSAGEKNFTEKLLVQ